MKTAKHENDCTCGCNRRQFIATTGTAAAGMFTLPMIDFFGSAEQPVLPVKQGATVKAVFFYPPSETFANKPDGWWSWPGNTWDAEGHQRRYTEEIGKISSKLKMNIGIKDKSVANNDDALKIVKEIESEKPDGLLLIMFYNNSLPQVDIVLGAADKLNIPAVFYIGLGVKHGSIRNYYERSGIYFIQSLDNFEAIESGMRMINTRKLLKQSVLLSIDPEEGRKESVEKFFGITTRPILVDTYNKEFKSMSINKNAADFINKLSKESVEVRGVTKESFEYAAKAYYTLKSFIEKENADAVTMNCLKVGLGRPCIGFSMLNNQLIPAICENDLDAAHGQMIGQLVTGRPGFQHNPCYDTEKNHYYASHCTTATKMYGPEGKELKYLLTRYFHTNDGTCCIQVFFNPGDPVAMIHYYRGEDPKLDIYSGVVVESHQMPPAGGCSTNVEIEITNRANANLVAGHHNLIFIGDFSRRFMNFAQLHKLPVMKQVV